MVGGVQENNKHESNPDTLALCLSLICASLIASLLVAQKAWMLEPRTYPRIPLIDSLSIPTAVEPLLYGIMLLSLVAFNFVARKKLLATLFFAAAATSILLDQTRLQPWLYLFSIMLLLGATCGSTSAAGVLNALRISIIGTYLFAGLQKFNLSFCESVIPLMLEKIVPNMPPTMGYAIGIPLAVMESSLAVLLSFKTSSRYGACAAIAFHGMTLLLLTHQNWNAVIWPWNIGMMLIVWFLFIRSGQDGILDLFRPDSAQKVVALVLFMLLPVLNFFGLWDNYLSAALYSGNVPVLRIELSRQDEETLPAQAKKGVRICDQKAVTLIGEEWAIGELGIPPYPERRVLEKVCLKLVKTGWFSHSRICIETYPRFFEGEKRRRMEYLSATDRH